MGGNSRAIDRHTGETLAIAEPLDLRIFSRKSFVRDFTELLMTLNVLDTYPCKRHEDFLGLSSEIFSGSSSHIFNPDISEKDLLKYKPVYGDIDVMVPREHRLKLYSLLQSLEGEIVTPSFRYLGQDRDNFGHTFLCIFEYTQGDKKVNLQVDFELVEFLNGLPTEWSKFSHSSSWEDTMAGLKGFYHKAILVNFYRAISRIQNSVLCTPSSNFHRYTLVKGKKSESTPRLLAFSVDRGLREKYTYITHPITKEICHHEGKILLKEIMPEDSVYITSVEELFLKAFPYAIHLDYKKFFFSAIGMMELIDAFCNEETKSFLFTYCLELSIFGTAQRINKWDWEKDREVKMGLGMFLGKGLKIKGYKRMLNRASEKYYENDK